MCYPMLAQKQTNQANAPQPSDLFGEHLSVGSPAGCNAPGQWRSLATVHERSL
jgi:hypothetical protein